MKEKIMKLDGPKRLAVIALALGLVAMFAGNPYNNTTTNVNTKEIALKTLNSQDKVKVKDLADWLIQKKADFTLIDLRSENEYKKYFIPSAYNISPVKLSDAGLMRNDKIVLYSDDNTTAAQAWFLLKSKDYKGVYILDGGLDAWKEQILFPALPENASAEQLTEFNKMKEVSLYFGGSPQSGTETAQKSFEMPELKAPVQTTLDMPRKKKKREGC